MGLSFFLFFKFISYPKFLNSQKVGNRHFPSFRRKPESSLFSSLQRFWTPVFTGVTTFYETLKFVTSL